MPRTPALKGRSTRRVDAALARIPSPRTDRGLPTARDIVAIVGLGYVGLPTALSLLDAGTHVIGLEASPDRIEAIRAAAVDLLPDDLIRLRRQLSTDRLDLTVDADRLTEADVIIVCVPTPVTAQLVPDLEALTAACRTVVDRARRGQTIILTSTTYVGCTRDLLEEPLRRRGLDPGHDVHVVFSPERVDPGVPDHSPASTPRVVGGLTPESTRHATAVLERTCPSLHPVSSPEVAEMAKLLENTFRAVNIAFANEMADVAAHLGLSAREVIEAAATKPYGFMAFMPGPGVGGHCIPCDPHYLLWQLRGHRVAAPVVDAAMTGIALRPRRVVTRLRDLLADHGRGLRGARVHVVGVAYKPGVADLRESPALEIIAECRAAGAAVTFTDRYIPELRLPDGTTLTSTPPQAVSADVVLVHTAHPGDDLSWVAGHALVLDATYRLDVVPHRAVL